MLIVINSHVVSPLRFKQMGILKSKSFWTFSTITTAVSSCVAYDRYQANVLFQQFLSEAAEYGREPLPHPYQPRCISLLLVAKDAAHHRAIRSTFKSFAVELLTVAGIDYKWVVETDGEAAALQWNQVARETNKPESMLDDTKRIGLVDLADRLLKPKLFQRANTEINETDADRFLWNSVRNKSSPLHLSEWSSGSDGFLALDPFTFDSLQATLQVLANEPAEVQPPTPPPTKPSSWFSWFKKTSPSPSPPVTPLRPLFPAQLYFVPCDHPQTALARLNRFLFGQRHLTQQIGSALLALIREQPETTINK